MKSFVKPSIKKPQYEELSEHYCEFFDHCSKVLSSDIPETFKLFVQNVLEYLNDWDHITWKQFKSVLKISISKEDYQKKVQGQINTFKFETEVLFFDKNTSFFTKKDFKGTTQQELDHFHEVIFGEKPRFWEEEKEGLILSYTKTGNRIFLLPTE